MGTAVSATDKMTSIRLNAKLADEAVSLMGANSRTEAVHAALEEVVTALRFKKMVKRYAGKGEFANSDE